MKSKGAGIQRVRESLINLNISTEVRELPNSTRTAQEAAAAVQCDVGQIVKSLVFHGKDSQTAILILTSGSNQVDEKIVGEYLGERIIFASADIVRQETGFSIGGVSPFGLLKELDIYIDEDLIGHDYVWAAAGSSNAVFRIEPNVLVDKTKGTIIKVN